MSKKIKTNAEWKHVRGNNYQSCAFRTIFNTLQKQGKYCSPRGQRILELEDYTYVLKPYVRFFNFKTRKMNLDYIKKEFLWYLKGDKYDTSICEHAKMWKSLINEDGSINSNYGQYIFGEQNQFDSVINTLLNDKDSRRASIVILSEKHLSSETNDYPCTYSLNFRIREGKLRMSVRMRSQDAVFGMTNDAPAFSLIQEMIYVTLRDSKYDDLKLGRYYHTVDSFHVYKRHFNILAAMSNKDQYNNNTEEYKIVWCPKISSKEEVVFLRQLHNDYDQEVSEDFKFTRWILDKEFKFGKTGTFSEDKFIDDDGWSSPSLIDERNEDKRLEKQRSSGPLVSQIKTDVWLGDK